MTLRSLVPTPAPSTSFTGTLTGGNGRADQHRGDGYYQVAIPSRPAGPERRHLHRECQQHLHGRVGGPDDRQSASTAVNTVRSTAGRSPSRTGPSCTCSIPTPGLWTLIIDFYNQVSGTAIAQPFSVTLDTTPATATRQRAARRGGHHAGGGDSR